MTPAAIHSPVTSHSCFPLFGRPFRFIAWIFVLIIFVVSHEGIHSIIIGDVSVIIPVVLLLLRWTEQFVHCRDSDENMSIFMNPWFARMLDLIVDGLAFFVDFSSL